MNYIVVELLWCLYNLLHFFFAPFRSFLMCHAARGTLNFRTYLWGRYSADACESRITNAKELPASCISMLKFVWLASITAHTIEQRERALARECCAECQTDWAMLPLEAATVLCPALHSIHAQLPPSSILHPPFSVLSGFCRISCGWAVAGARGLRLWCSANKRESWLACQMRRVC